MVKFKIAIKWSDGTWSGVAGEGDTWDLAKDEAYAKVYEMAAKKGMSFSLIKDLDIFAESADVQRQVKADWDGEKEEKSMYQWGWP